MARRPTLKETKRASARAPQSAAPILADDYEADAEIPEDEDAPIAGMSPSDMEEPPEDEAPEMDDEAIVRWVLGCKRESADARKDRLNKNRRNRDANLGRQDWSHKIKGQSREFIPKVHMAAEQFAAFVKRAMTQFGRWYQVDQRTDMRVPLREEKVAELLDHYLSHIYQGNNRYTSFSTIISDGVKLALFESMIIIKIHGEFCAKTRWYVEPGETPAEPEIAMADEDLPPPPEPELKSRTIWPWKLRVDLCRPDSYFPDPTGRGLYEIHEVYRDLHDVVDMAEKGIYESSVVEKIHADFMDEEDAVKEREAKGQRHSHPAPGRKQVKITEFWGTVLDTDGLVAHRNCVLALANEKYVIRRPEPNPFWHGMSPFLAIPLIRVPLSVDHVALYDDAVNLNLIYNEMMNLIIDGGLASVWGIRQVRVDELEDPESISGGIGQGMTLAVKSTLAHNAKVLEKVSEGQVPQDAFATLELLGREFNQSALTNDIKLGSLPQRAVTATEVNDASNSQTTTLDAIASDLENELLVPALTRIFMTVVQHLEWMDAHEMVSAVGPATTLMLARMSTAERYAAFGYSYGYKVHGLSAVMTRARDFQRFMALLQAVMTNPILLQEFVATASGKKILVQMMKMLNINPDSIAMTPEEMAALPQKLEQLPLFMMLTSQTKGGGRVDGSGGPDSSMPAEVNQMENPVSGMGGGT